MRTAARRRRSARRKSAPAIVTAASIRSCSSPTLPRATPTRRRPSRNFSRAWYNGTDYRFDLTALRALEDDLFEHCLAVLRLDHRPAVEVHGYFPGGEQRWQQIITRWNLDKRPAPEPAPVHGERYQARYVTNQEAPGYRDMTLVVAIDGESARQLPIELHFSAGDSERIARDLIDLHRGAGRSREWREGPLDMKEGELRPQWL